MSGVKPPKDYYEKRLKKMMRKFVLALVILSALSFFCGKSFASGIQPGGGGGGGSGVSQTNGTAVFDYKEVLVAPSATDDHTYTAVGTAFRLTSFVAAASGLIKIEVFVNGVQKYTLFNSSSNNNVTINITENVDAAVGQIVLVRVTNREVTNQTIYSTIIGEQLE